LIISPGSKELQRNSKMQPSKSLLPFNADPNNFFRHDEKYERLGNSQSRFRYPDLVN